MYKDRDRDRDYDRGERGDRRDRGDRGDRGERGDRDDDRKGRRGRPEKCRFCRSEFPPDYKDIDTLERLITGQGKMFSRKRSGNCAHHQRQFALAVKQARFLGLISYVG